LELGEGCISNPLLIMRGCKPPRACAFSCSLSDLTIWQNYSILWYYAYDSTQQVTAT